MLKKLLGSVFFGVVLLGLTSPAYAYIATISQSGGTAPYPVRVGKRFSHWLDIKNVDLYQAVYGLKFEYFPPVTDGLTLVGYTVRRMNDGKILCRTLVCEAGNLMIGDTVRATATYRALKTGNYDYLWFITHDGWITPNGGMLTVVR